MKLILASASPRRAEILHNAGFEFSVEPADADESRMGDESAEEHVRRLARRKARLVAERTKKTEIAPAVVIGADTVVVIDGQILGKPTDQNDARRMLRLLSGRAHEVLTGISVIALPAGRERDHVERTRVQFLDLSSAEIEEYVGGGEPMDKAGAYGIQGIGGRFVSRIEGCYFNVMGLPVSRLWSILKSIGETGTKAG